jgi:HEAT repeat protein
VGEVGDGRVRMSFTAREGVCGWGDGGRTVNIRWRSDDWENACEGGPVRVVLRIRNGVPTDLDTYIGGRWRTRRGVTDIGHVPAREAAEYLLGLAEDFDDDVGKDAIFPAAMADSVTVWPDLARIAQNDSRPLELRKQAVFWIGQNADDGAVGVLEDILDSSPEHEIRERAIFALSQHDSDRSTIVLRDIAASRRESRRLRERAIFWLGQGGDEDAAEFLRDLYGETSEYDLKERIIFSLSQMRDAGNRRWLLGIATDDEESMELREKAIFWAGQMRNSTVELVDLYDHMNNSSLRERLIFSLSQKRRDPEAMEKLMDIARDDPDRELRGKAIFWLGQSRDRRAAEFLAELINR